MATVDYCQVAEKVDLPFRYRQAEIDARAEHATNLRKELELNKALELCPQKPSPQS